MLSVVDNQRAAFQSPGQLDNIVIVLGGDSGLQTFDNGVVLKILSSEDPDLPEGGSYVVILVVLEVHVVLRFLIVAESSGAFSAHKSPRADAFVTDLCLELVIPLFKRKSSQIEDVSNTSGMGEQIFRFSEKHHCTEAVLEREARLVVVQGLVHDFHFSDVLSIFESVGAGTVDNQTQGAGFFGLVGSVGEEELVE